MQIRIHRKPGPFGSRAPLDVLINGEKALSLAEKEQAFLTVSSESPNISVAMHGQVGSQNLVLSGEHTNLECGVRPWLALDLLNLCYLPLLRKHVFFLRPVSEHP